MKLTKLQLKQIIKEELDAIVKELGVASDMKVVDQEELEEKKKGMFDQPNFKSKVAWVKRNKPGVKDPDAYVAGALRKAGEIK